MAHFLNNPDTAVEDMLEGFCHANSDYVKRVSPRVLLSTSRKPGVAVVTGGGSGHKPAFIGYLGRGLLDAVAVGDIFTSPPASVALAAIEAANKGQGVICPIGNYSGDVMNFEMAAELAATKGIDVRLVIATDDMGAGSVIGEEQRRGVAGQAFVWKLCGAMADQGYGLDEIESEARLLNANMRSMGVAATSLTHPQTGKQTFDIADGEMEFGVGHHGEPGRSREPIQSVSDLVRRFLEEIRSELSFGSNDNIAVLINGLGATTQLELYVVYAELIRQLAVDKLEPCVAWVGEHFTALEMAGFSVTLAKLNNTQLAAIKRPANAVSIKHLEANS